MVQRCIILCLFIFVVTTAVHADETDQFTLPERESFADLGPFFNAAHYHVLEKVVDRLNARIDRALNISDPTMRKSQLEACHSPMRIADMIRHEFGTGLTEMRSLENVIGSRKLKKMHGEHRTGYRTMGWIYSDVHLPFDPRKFMLLFVASTVNVNGHYVGLDKFGHFHDLGHIYYKDYIALRNGGVSDEEATATIVHRFSRGPISETAIIGSFATGVQSNADLASNYSGFKFFRNLTETIRMGERELPPLLIRVGNFWALNTHVRPDNNFFEPFVTDHWNEALNPNIYEWSMRNPIRKRLRKQAADIRAFYVDADGNERTAENFRKLEEELSTLFGEDYGYIRISEEKMVTIANSCFDDDTDLAEEEFPQDNAARLRHDAVHTADAAEVIETPAKQ